VNELRATLPGLVVLPAHDPTAARRLQAALHAAEDVSADPGAAAS